MGYSIAIRTRSPKLQQKMLRFMKANYRNWPTVEGRPEGNAYAGEPSDDISYDKSKSLIGLDYGAVSGWERVYAYTITRWMALKVGGLRATFPNVTPSRTSKPVPYMVYDGYEAWPILLADTPAQLKQIPKPYRWCTYTSLGMHADVVEYVRGELVIDLAEDTTRMFNEVHAKLGPKPEGPPSPRYDAKFEAWVDRRHRLMLPYCRKKLRPAVKVLKDEMQRLDDLWNAQ